MPPPHAVGFVGLLLLTAALQAQPPGEPSKAKLDPLLAFKGKRLDADHPTDRDQRDYYRMVLGSDVEYPLSSDRRKDLLNRVPRWLIYRLTWDEIHEGRGDYTTSDLMKGTPEGLVDGILEAFPPATFRSPNEDPYVMEKRQRQRKYLKEFRPVAVGYLREVLQNRLLVARLNAATVLHRFAQFGEEEVADDLLAVLEDPNEHDAVKHWAIKGMGEVFAQAEGDSKDPKRLQRCALAVYEWLENRTQTSAGQLTEMSEPEKDGIRYVRREAIRTLGNYGRPMIVEDTQAKHQEGPLAALLLQIMGNDSIEPEAGWSEREAAAVALCNLQHKRSPSYQPDFVIHHIARFIADLGQEASRDSDRTTQRWQFYAADLKSGTDTLAEDLGKGNPSALYLSRVMLRVNPVLENLYDQTRFQSAVGDLNEALNSLPPSGQAAFKVAGAEKQ